MKLPKKSISILLSVIMVFSLFAIVPFEASAAEASSWSALKDLLEQTGSNTITLNTDVKAGESDACLTIASGKNFTIDLNGHTLSRGRTEVDDNGSVIAVKNGGTLTITDSSADSSGKITGGYSKDGGAIRNEGIEDFPIGDPVIVEVMTSSTSGGNKKKRSCIPQAFEDCMLGKPHLAPGINYRQVWARMASQLIVIVNE